MGIMFVCNQSNCNFSTPKFKELIDHYNLYHHGQGLKRYQIKHRIRGDSAIITAPSAQEACEAVGWRIGDCFVKEIGE